MRIAKIENGNVVNVYLSDKLLSVDDIDITENELPVSIGWWLEGGNFTPPDAPETAHVGPIPLTGPRTTGTAREFMDILTDEELLAIVTLTQAIPLIKIWYDRAISGDVWMKHPDVDTGLSLLVDAGEMTNERKAELINWNFAA